jgi:acyl-CoA oxidase
MPHPPNHDQRLTIYTAHSQAILVANFYEAVRSNSGLSEPTGDALRLLYRLFALSTMENDGREFCSANAVSNEQLDMLNTRVLRLMQQIRPHAVKLVDAWSIPDYLLDR